MSYAKELKVALDAVRRASFLTHSVAKQNVSALEKDDKSPVTVADYGAQAVINSAIRQAFPNDNIVGEESSDEVKTHPELATQLVRLASQFAPEDPRFATTAEQADQSLEKAIANLCEAIDFGKYEGGSKGRQWALDPVDGTKGFLRGGQYAVCLALIVDAEVKLGVIGCPNLGKQGGIYYAVRNQGGSWFPLYAADGEALPDGGAEPQALRFREVESVSDAQFCESVEAGHSAQGKQEKIAHTLGLTKPSIRMDSQAKYCSLASGAADIYLRLPVSLSYEEKIWDHAAGSLLITEAGGVVTDMYGSALDFGQGRTLKNNKGIVASSKALQPKLLQIIAEPEK